jgi:hypothetical protein
MWVDSMAEKKANLTESKLVGRMGGKQVVLRATRTVAKMADDWDVQTAETTDDY